MNAYIILEFQLLKDKQFRIHQYHQVYLPLTTTATVHQFPLQLVQVQEQQQALPQEIVHVREMILKGLVIDKSEKEDHRSRIKPILFLMVWWVT